MIAPIYVAAREVLLDALEALGEQRQAVILAGAQAIYLHTGDADLAVVEYTTDSDLVVDPALLKNDLEPDSVQRAGHAAPEPLRLVNSGRAGRRVGAGVVME